MAEKKAGDDVPVETGNYPLPEDGAQDLVVQTRLPQYDEDLVDGATLESDS